MLTINIQVTLIIKSLGSNEPPQFISIITFDRFKTPPALITNLFELGSLNLILPERDNYIDQLQHQPTHKIPLWEQNHPNQIPQLIVHV